jgi:hypothetical protein
MIEICIYTYHFFVSKSGNANKFIRSIVKTAVTENGAIWRDRESESVATGGVVNGLGELMSDRWLLRITQE